jgi:hypothetical protein
MLDHLLEVYHSSVSDSGSPGCAFRETLIFNEGWLLRAVLEAWRSRRTEGPFAFLPFPPDAAYYSEGQLRTPFAARRRGDPLAETHTHVDGIVGHFSIDTRTHSGIRLAPHARYIAVFEAKLYSPLSAGTRHAAGYDQVARTAACLLHALITSGARPAATHLAVLYPSDNRGVRPERHELPALQAAIAARLQQYQAARGGAEVFAADWQARLGEISLSFVTWEDALAGLDDRTFDEFYRLSRRFNRPARKAVPDE